MDVVSLAIGEPGHPAPNNALDAARLALAEGRLGYTDALGRNALREALASHYERRYGVRVGADRIAITTGSSAGFNLAFLTLFDVGDTVAIACPGYPAYRNILKALGLDVLEIAIGAENGFTLTPESLELAEMRTGKRIAGVLLASPANPTGTVTGKLGLRALADWCKSRDVHFISDEIYHGLTFSGEETSALEVTDDAIVINSFSKYYCMTGWRIGWMVLPSNAVRAFERLAQSLYISPPTLSQIAALAALDAGAELEVVKGSYRRNRALLTTRLPEMGMPLLSPADGAFYAYADVGRYTNDSMEFARRILFDTGVAITPGIDFDPVNGHTAVRLSYAGADSDIEKAVDRIDAWLQKYR
jgi:aspartate/methionine/tyrosine aminotransferase